MALTLTLDALLDGFEHLPDEQQEMLFEIIRRRQSAQRRRRMAEDAQHSLALFRSGELEPATAEEIIDSLRKSLSGPDDDI